MHGVNIKLKAYNNFLFHYIHIHLCTYVSDLIMVECNDRNMLQESK
jgi:hypothetical protein